MPRGIVNAITLLYRNNKGYGSAKGVIKFLFLISCGVLQGCPLSGSLFVICIDPLLTLFKRFVMVPGKGEVRACADDIGIILRELKHLKIVFRLFDLFGKASGLKLKPP